EEPTEFVLKSRANYAQRAEHMKVLEGNDVRIFNDKDGNMLRLARKDEKGLETIVDGDRTVWQRLADGKSWARSGPDPHDYKVVYDVKIDEKGNVSYERNRDGVADGFFKSYPRYRVTEFIDGRMRTEPIYR